MKPRTSKDKVLSILKILSDSPVVKVTTITMRKDAIFQALLTGMPTTENQSLKKWALTASAYRKVAKVMPSPDDIRGINLTNSSAGRHAIVSIRKREKKQHRRGLLRPSWE